MALAVVTLTACSERGTIVFYPEAEGVGSTHQLLVATTRLESEGPEVFARGRSDALGLARFTISVPPVREPGTVVFPDDLPPDPMTDFVTLSAQRLGNADAFRAAANAIMRAPGATREATIFSHGFNNTFAEGLYRQVQMREDFGMPGLSVHYAWPSAGLLSGYARDRESAIFARDGLEEVIDLVASTEAQRIVVAAHSMGALVAMETLRQMALRRSPSLRRVQSVVLMNPDLDIDVFRRQMREIEPFDVPVYIFVSSGDRALRASSLLRGDSARLGSINDVSALAGLPVTVIDLSSIEDNSTDALGHMAVATSPSMIALISGMRDLGGNIFEDELRNPTLFEGTVNVVQGATKLVLDPIAPE
jgi:esterase/lipase superfamily enzyme